MPKARFLVESRPSVWGLVDELMGLYQAGRKIHQELKLTKEFGLKYFKEEKRFFIKNILEDIEARFDDWEKGGFLISFPS